jgi:hypothetical protein
LVECVVPDLPWREAAVEEDEVSVRHRAFGNARRNSVKREIVRRSSRSR